MERRCNFTILYKENDKTERENYRSIFIVSHAGKILIKMVARRLGDHREAKGLFPEEEATDIMLVLRGLQEIGRKAGVSL